MHVVWLLFETQLLAILKAKCQQISKNCLYPYGHIVGEFARVALEESLAVELELCGGYPIIVELLMICSAALIICFLPGERIPHQVSDRIPKRNHVIPPRELIAQVCVV